VFVRFNRWATSVRIPMTTHTWNLQPVRHITNTQLCCSLHLSHLEAIQFKTCSLLHRYVSQIGIACGFRARPPLLLLPSSSSRLSSSHRNVSSCCGSRTGTKWQCVALCAFFLAGRRKCLDSCPSTLSCCYLCSAFPSATHTLLLSRGDVDCCCA
jgi:hypothetical protein